METYKTYNEEVKDKYREAMKIHIDNNKLFTDTQKRILSEYKDDLESKVPIHYRDESNKLIKLKPLESIQSIDTYLRKTINLLIYIKKEVGDITKEDLKSYRLYLKNTSIGERNDCEGRRDRYLSNTIIEFYFNLIKTFFIWYYNKDDNKNILPDLVQNFNRSPIKRDKLNQSELLTPEEIKLMIEDSNKTRDKCFVSTLFESAARSGEILACNISSFEDKGEYGLLTLKGKSKKSRKVPISDSLYYLRKWVNEHPNKDNPNAPLFLSHSKEHMHERITRYGANYIIKRMAKSINLKKKHNLHWFRHSCLDLIYRTTGINEYDLRIFAGWSPNSNMQEIYIHYDQSGVWDKILKSKNKEIVLTTANDKALHTKICTKCLNLFHNDSSIWEHPATAKYCTCGQILDKEEIIKVEKMRNDENKFNEILNSPSIMGNVDLSKGLNDGLFTAIMNNAALKDRFVEFVNKYELDKV